MEHSILCPIGSKMASLYKNQNRVNGRYYLDFTFKCNHKLVPVWPRSPPPQFRNRATLIQRRKNMHILDLRTDERCTVASYGTTKQMKRSDMKGPIQ